MEKSLRKKIVAAVLTFMLVMSAVMALFFMPSVEDYRGAQSIGIRFKQVVLGGIQWNFPRKAPMQWEQGTV